MKYLFPMQAASAVAMTINRGPAWPGVEALRFHLRENATVTVQ